MQIRAAIAQRAQARITAAVDAMEDEGSKYIVTCVDQVKAVAMDVEAFAMMRESAEIALKFFEKRLDGLTLTASGIARPEHLDGRARKAG